MVEILRKKFSCRLARESFFTTSTTTTTPIAARAREHSRPVRRGAQKDGSSLALVLLSLAPDGVQNFRVIAPSSLLSLSRSYIRNTYARERGGAHSYSSEGAGERGTVIFASISRFFVLLLRFLRLASSLSPLSFSFYFFAATLSLSRARASPFLPFLFLFFAARVEERERERERRGRERGMEKVYTEKSQTDIEYLIWE